MSSNERRKSDLKERVVVLVALTLLVFLPIYNSAVACVGLFYIAVSIGSCEWLLGVYKSSAFQSLYLGKSNDKARHVCVVSFALIGLFIWLAPWFTNIMPWVLGPCPGHKLAMETIEVVLLVSDSAQLGCGRYLGGKTKFLPSISPKKTIEGYIGGFVITVLYACLIRGWAIRVAICVFCAGVFGDLYFSTFKRLLGIKDFSSLLGAHGGVCDRIDSYIFALLAISYLVC
mmetsp:Transcript_15923/g.24907  ORF Transcript_15923/g.24907 Transcript_15923/m.24907 type:complete len:230 (-) Transcript_15923:942-1631(-)